MAFRSQILVWSNEKLEEYVAQHMRLPQQCCICAHEFLNAGDFRYQPVELLRYEPAYFIAETESRRTSWLRWARMYGGILVLCTDTTGLNERGGTCLDQFLAQHAGARQILTRLLGKR